MQHLPANSGKVWGLLERDKEKVTQTISPIDVSVALTTIQNLRGTRSCLFQSQSYFSSFWFVYYYPTKFELPQTDTKRHGHQGGIVKRLHSCRGSLLIFQKLSETHTRLISHGFRNQGSPAAHQRL